MVDNKSMGDEFELLSRCSKEKIFVRFASSSDNETDTESEEKSSQTSRNLPTCSHLSEEPTDEVTKALDLIMDRCGDPHDPTLESSGTKSPICKAVELGQYSTVRSLLDAGFDLAAKDCDGNSALHLAVYLRLYDIIQLLLSRQSPLDSCNNVGYTPLHMAVLNRDYHATQLILLSNQRPVLSYGSQGVVCPPIDLRALFSGDTCLHIATEQNCLDLVKLLIDHGANMDALNFHSQSPLILACRYEYLDIISLLCSKGANPNLKGYFGNERVTPIGLCSRLNKLDITRILVHHGADLNVPDDCGPSPLFTALTHQSNEITDFFFSECLDQKMDVKICRRNRETLLHALLQYKGEKRCLYARELVIRGCSVNQATRSKQCPLHEAICWRDHSMAKVLLELGADWRLLDRWGQNALHVAVATGDIEFVKLLLYYGADINSVTSLGVSSLFISLEFEYPHTAEYLIYHGSNLGQELYLLKSELTRPLFIAMENKVTPRFLHHGSPLKDKLMSLAESPSPLLSLCITKVREMLLNRCNCLCEATSLPIPSLLQHRISFDYDLGI